MEIYIYGTFGEVMTAKMVLQNRFPFVKEARPVFDLPILAEQDFCRIYVRDDRKETFENGTNEQR